MLQVLRQEHRRHAPATQLALDRVAVSESLTQGVEQIGHGTWGLAYHALQPPASVAAPAAGGGRAGEEIGRAHDRTPGPGTTRMPTSAFQTKIDKHRHTHHTA